MPATVSRRKANAIQLSRSRAADRWRPGYQRALRQLLRHETGTAVKAFVESDNRRFDFKRVFGVKWTREMETLKKRFIYSMVAAGYKWADQEFGESTEGKQIGSPGPDIPLTAAIGEGDEFLIRARFKDIDKWVDTTSLKESTTKAKKLQRSLEIASTKTVKVISAAGREYTRGRTVAELAKVIRRRGLADDMVRARMLARTGTIWAFNEGAQQRYRSAGVQAMQWVTTDDDALCFIGNTLVEGKDNVKKIKDINVGDVVRTRTGFHSVTQTFRNPCERNLVGVMYERQLLICTTDHPIWVQSVGWVAAGDIEPGYLLQGVKDEPVKVLRVLDLPFPKTKDNPSIALKVSRFASVLSQIAVPIISVNFNRDLCTGKGKVDSIATDLHFLNKRDTKTTQGFSDGGFDTCLPRRLPVTSDGAEDLLRGRNQAERLSARSTLSILRRAVAFLRAVFSVKSSCFEYLTASSARTITSKPISAGPATDGHSRFLPWGNRVRLTTDGAALCNLFDTTQVTDSRAEFRVRWDSTTRTEGFTTYLAKKVYSFMVAFITAILRPRRSTKFLAATLTSFKHLVLLARTYYILFRCRGEVFNLEIEGDHTFYANGILVHNCPFCNTMNESIVRLDDPFVEADGSVPGTVSEGMKPTSLLTPFEVQHPPLHPNCRCTVVPVLSEIGEEPIESRAGAEELPQEIREPKFLPLTNRDIGNLRKKLLQSKDVADEDIKTLIKRNNEIQEELDRRAQWGFDGKKPDGTKYVYKKDPVVDKLNTELFKNTHQKTKLNQQRSRRLRKFLEVPRDRRSEYRAVNKFKRIPKDLKSSVEKRVTKSTNKAFDDISRLFDKSNQPSGSQGVDVLHDWKKRRADYSNASKRIGLSTGSKERAIFHEFGHHVENTLPKARDAAVKFLEKRTQGETAQKLQKLFPGRGYGKGEVTKKDAFLNAYTGKDGDASEVISMGLQHLYEDPTGFARADPEHFDLIVGILRGRFAP